MSKITELVEDLGRCQFSENEVEIIIEHEMTKDEKKAYIKGVLLGEYEVRKVILQMAEQGSTPAIQQFKELTEGREKIKF